MSKEHRVLGPPGTGKTYFLARQCERLASDPRYGVHSMIIASLTRAAAAEIGGRTNLPKWAVGTLHAHCHRALGRPSLAESKDGLKAWNEWCKTNGERSGLMVNPAAGRDVEYANPEQMNSTTDGEKLLQQLAMVRARMTPPELWPAKVAQFAAKWDRFKDDENMYDFTDLIEMAIRQEVKLPDGVRVMMLDEAQDMSRLEFTLARMWAEQVEQLVVVGDPDQNIFSWRGSDPEAFFAGEVASERILSRSRRVPAAVHRYAVDWIEKIPSRHPVEYQPRFNDPNDESSGIAPGEVRVKRLTWQKPLRVVDSVRDDLEAGETVMLLTSCSYMLAPLLKHLREQGIPFHNPYRVKNGAWNPLRGAERMLAFLRGDPGTWGDLQRMWTWSEIDQWTQHLDSKRCMIHKAKKRIAQLATTTPDKRADFDVFPKLFQEDALDWIVSLDPAAWVDHLLPTHRRPQLYPLEIYRRFGGQALREKPRVVVGTIHSVKGGECDSVYVFPDLSHAGFTTGMNQGGNRPMPLPSTRRLFYVAFTRARERLTLCAPSTGEYVRFPEPKGVSV